MKSLILAITLVFSSTSFANSNELVVDLLKKPNTKINIKNLELAQTYSYGKTCAATDEDGYCTKFGEHVYTLQNYIYTNIASHSYSYKTAENYEVKWRCWGTFDGKSADQIANYPADFKKEYRFSYTNQMGGHVLAPASVVFKVKDQYQVLKTKLVENNLVESELCHAGDAGDDSPAVCVGVHKWRTLRFSAPVSQSSSFEFSCQASVPVDSKDSLDLTTEILHKLLNGEAFLTE